MAFEEEEWGEASLHYEAVVAASSNEYTEQALVRMTQALVQLEEKEKSRCLLEAIGNSCAVRRKQTLRSVQPNAACLCD